MKMPPEAFARKRTIDLPIGWRVKATIAGDEPESKQWKPPAAEVVLPKYTALSGLNLQTPIYPETAEISPTFQRALSRKEYGGSNPPSSARQLLS
jgi:hypothetical protein